MSNKAVDADGCEHFANDFQDRYAGDYFCPDPACHVRMKLKNIGSDKKAYGVRNPYFSAGRGEPHIQGCAYQKTCVSYESLQEAGFCADEFFHSLQTGGADVCRRPHNTAEAPVHAETHDNITTLNKLYHYCLQHKDADTVPDGSRIFELFQDARNRNVPNWQRHSSRLVKLRFLNCNFKEFDQERYCYKLWCMFPHTETTKPPGIYYTLGFREDSIPLMRYFCEILTPLKRKLGDLFLLVGGEWSGNHCYIASKRQIFILSENN